jgi:hypothetical protein
MVADAGARQVHDRVGALERRRVEAAAGGIPRHGIGGGGAVAPHQPHHVVAVVAQLLDERGPDEAAGTGDDDAHGAAP